MLTTDQRYQAVTSRDRRFDGMFFTAVRTTGIFCRPSCPARTPRPENVEFFSTAAAAAEAGFRACRRRSEERRVGKECRYRWSPYYSKKRYKIIIDGKAYD